MVLSLVGSDLDGLLRTVYTDPCSRQGLTPGPNKRTLEPDARYQENSTRTSPSDELEISVLISLCVLSR